MTIFERLAYAQPEILLARATMGMLCIEDYIPAGMAVLMRHAAWHRVNRRLGQVRAG